MSEQREAERPRTPSADPDAEAPTIPEDLVAMLDLLAQTIVDALGFGVAAVNIARPDGTLKVVSVAGDETARRMLLGTVDSAATWDHLLAASEPWGRLRFADHRSEAANVDMMTWVPDIEPLDIEDAWHPEDALFAPLTAGDGSRLGILSVDLPHDGRRPGPTGRAALEAFAISAALAIEHSTLRFRAEEAERSLAHRATHDALTGVGNRAMMQDRLLHALAVRAEQRSLLALTFIDLDGFKAINDRFSHAAGDCVLEVVASRIQRAVRARDTVARWGGDEFLVLHEGLVDEYDGREIAHRIWAAISEPFHCLGQEISVTTSLGTAFCRPTDRIEAADLLRRADTAMYQVKQAGRNGCATFEW